LYWWFNVGFGDSSGESTRTNAPPRCRPAVDLRVPDSGASRKPALGREADLHEHQHHGNLDQPTDDGGEGCSRLLLDGPGEFHAATKQLVHYCRSVGLPLAGNVLDEQEYLLVQVHREIQFHSVPEEFPSHALREIVLSLRSPSTSHVWSVFPAARILMLCNSRLCPLPWQGRGTGCTNVGGQRGSRFWVSSDRVGGSRRAVMSAGETSAGSRGRSSRASASRALR
jgi:hypothetical protein